MRDRIYIKDYAYLAGEKQLMQDTADRYVFALGESLDKELASIERKFKTLEVTHD